MEKIKIHATDPVWGVQLGIRTISVHDKGECGGEFCCIHNPSNHPLKDAPLNWRSDKRQMERLCEHGVGHVDPDDTAYWETVDPGSSSWRGIHGCDGCCQSGG